MNLNFSPSAAEWPFKKVNPIESQNILNIQHVHCVAYTMYTWLTNLNWLSYVNESYQVLCGGLLEALHSSMIIRHGWGAVSQLCAWAEI